MAFKSGQNKINDLEIVRQKVRRPYMARSTRGSSVCHDQPSVGDSDQECWTRVDRVSTGRLSRSRVV